MKFMLAVDDKIKPWLMSKLETYKFRSDVVVTTDMNELNDIMASAYATICSKGTTPSIHLSAMQNETPLIVHTDAYLRSSYGEAVVFAETDEKDISKNMILLYKNEQMRSEQIEKGRLLARERSWQLIAETIWERVIFPETA